MNVQKANLSVKRLDSVNLNWFLDYVRGQRNRMDNGTMWYCTIVLSKVYEICFRSPEHLWKQEIVPLPSKPSIYSPVSGMNSTVSVKLDGNEPVKTGKSPDN